MPGYSEIKIQTNFDESFLYTDKFRLKIILNNLLTNAIKYQRKISNHSSCVAVSVYRHQESISIDIKDNGEGIHPNHQPRIFDMFYRATASTPGSGLGLYIAKEAAEKIGGHISVQSEYGVGSTFKIQLKDLSPVTDVSKIGA